MTPSPLEATGPLPSPSRPGSAVPTAVPTAPVAVAAPATAPAAATPAAPRAAVLPAAGTVIDCAPHALRELAGGAPAEAGTLLVRRTVARTPEQVRRALSDPSALLLLLGADRVAGIVRAPWHLEPGATVEFTPRRRGADSATLTVLPARPGGEPGWRVDFRRGSRIVATQVAGLRLAEHPLGCSVELAVTDSGARGVLPGRRRELLRDLTAGLRELDLLLTRHDR